MPQEANSAFEKEKMQVGGDSAILMNFPKQRGK
jgi:hypothetical protein